MSAGLLTICLKVNLSCEPEAPLLPLQTHIDRCHSMLGVNAGHSADGAVVLRLCIWARHVCWALDQLLEGQLFL